MEVASSCVGNVLKVVYLHHTFATKKDHQILKPFTKCLEPATSLSSFLISLIMTVATQYEPSLTRLTLVSMILFTVAFPKSSPSNNRFVFSFLIMIMIG